jgi:gliding motility-associated-like protein
VSEKKPFLRYLFWIVLTYPSLPGISQSGCPDLINPQQANIISTPDTTICLGSSLVLHTVPSLEFCWSPVNGLNDPSQANPVATPATTTTWYFTARALGPNLIANGDFSKGSTQFSTAYKYATTNDAEGQYFVGPSPQKWRVNNPPGCGDHSSGSGNMLMINGFPAPGMIVWMQQVTVMPNNQYAFSLWVQTLAAQNPATLEITINGVQLGNILIAPPTACNWQPFNANWSSGTNTTALISVVDTATVKAGNDFAIDDISLSSIAIQKDSIHVTVEDPRVTGFPDTMLCPGMPVQLGAGGASFYSWSPAAGLSDSKIADPIARPSQTTSYTVTGTTAHGCAATHTVLITTYPHVSTILTADTSICLGSPLSLQAEGGLIYTWSPAQYLSDPGAQNPVARPDRTTRFYLTATDADQCNEMDSVTLGIRPIPVFQAPLNTSVCKGYSVMLNEKNAARYNYAWSPSSSLNDPYSATPIANPESSTVYTVRISDLVCERYDSEFDVSVEVKPNPIITVQKANDIDCSIATAKLIANGANSFTWVPAAGLSDPTIANPLVSVDSTTTFVVRGTAGNGCYAFDTLTVKVTATGRNLFVVPNAFSPNGDGRNDCFGISRWGDVRIEEFSIYNRKGARVFTTRNPSECWDGNFRGRPQEAGAYPYVIKAASFCGAITRTGVVVLIR